MDFIAHYKAARRVSTPLVCIRTFDANSTLGQVRGALGDKVSDNALLIWDAVHGLRSLTQRGDEELAHLLDGAPPEATVALPTTLEMAERATSNVTLFVSNAHLQWPNEPTVIQGIWNLRDPFKANGNMLILLANPGAVLPLELTNDVLVLDEPLPTVEEIQAIVNNTFKFAEISAPDTATLDKATDALIGLPSFAAEQSTAMCLNLSKTGPDGTRTGTLDIPSLWEHKRQVISQTPGLSVWQGSERMEDIGGILQVKQFLSQVLTGNEPPKTILFIDEIEKAFAGTGTELSGVTTQMTGAMLSWMQDKDMDGVIFIGLPGVSKSQLAKAAGGSFGIPVVNFDIAGMQSGIIGSSGANLRAAQATVDAISGGRSLAIATCNSIHALPPELRRRFNLGIFFFDAPTAEERKAIWSIYRERYGVPDTQPCPPDEGWTGAEIKECCKKAYRLNMSLSEAARYIIPITRSSAEQVAALRQSCTGKYLSASQPGVYQMAGSVPTAAAQRPATVSRGRVLRQEGE